MIYEVVWKVEADVVRLPSRFATWGGKVVDTTPALAWALGQPYESVRIRLETAYGARIRIIADSEMKKWIDGRS